MNLDMGVLYHEIVRHDQGRRLYGYISLMAPCSTRQLGALSVESYCEHILSVANQVAVEGNTMLKDEEIEMLVVLHMIRR